MALEKKQVLPKRFRYVCDSCPFEWPRTPVKESELLPPPTHSCPNKGRPDMKAILEKHEKRANGSTRPKPVAVCTRCGGVSYATDQINGQCAQRLAGKRCVGVNGSALNDDDWKQCAACAGSGRIGASRCGRCDGVGWLYVRR